MTIFDKEKWFFKKNYLPKIKIYFKMCMLFFKQQKTTKTNYVLRTRNQIIC